MKWVLLVVVSLVALGAAAQTNYYVAPSGSDSNDGSAAHPWRTIGHADGSVSIGANGTVVHVAAGTYGGNLSCAGTQYNSVVCVNRGGTSQTARLRYQCDTPATLAMLGTPQGCYIVSTGSTFIGWSGGGYPNGANYVDIVGFHFGPNPTGFAHIGTSCASGLATDAQCPNVNSWHISGNLLEAIGSQNACDINHMGASIETAGRHGNWAADTQIVGNMIAPYGNPRGVCQYGYAVYMNGKNQTAYNNIMWGSRIGFHVYDGACGTTISNNLIMNMVELGIMIWNHSTYGDCASGKGGNTIDNNVIVNTGAGWSPLYNEGAGIQASGSCDSSHPTLISNNLMSGNVAGNFLGYNGTAFDSCASIQNNKSENPTNTFVNFKNDGTGDYHLQTASIANGTGTTTCVSGRIGPCVPALDFDATLRPATGLAIGPFEAGTSSASSPNPPSGLTATAQ